MHCSAKKFLESGFLPFERKTAQLLGVGKTQISEMENGNAFTTLEKLVLICEHYHVSSDYLLGLSDES